MGRQAALASFFLGAETPGGYLSFFSQDAWKMQNWERVVIKGGPEAGEMLEKLEERLRENGTVFFRVPCAEDPERSDGVILPGEKVLVLNGAPPRGIDPELPGVSERVICLEECRRKEELYAAREEIFALAEERRLCRERCGRFLSAAGALIRDVSAVAMEDIDREKLERFALKYAAEHFKKSVPECSGTDYSCFLSAVTPDGVTGYWREAKGLCPKVWILEDAYGAVSRQLLARLRELALKSGEDVISCYCPLTPCEKLDHLLFPRLGTALFTSGRFHRLEIEGVRRIHAERFLSMDHIRTHQKKLGFHVKAARQLIAEAGRQQARALELEKGIFALYRAATDPERLEKQTEELLRTVEAAAGRAYRQC